MRATTLGILTAALALLWSGAAWACPVEGTVICQKAAPTDTAVPLAGVKLTFTDGTFTYPNEYSPAPAPTDSSGFYAFRVAGGRGACPGDWTVTMDLTALGGPAAVQLPSQVYIAYDPDAWVLPPIEVSGDLVPACGGTPPGPLCDLTAVPAGALACEEHPWGNPRAECAHFGEFVPTGSGWATSNGRIVATAAADFAIVKAARACYAITKDVSIGDVLAVPLAGGVSHVTYCSCPTP